MPTACVIGMAVCDERAFYRTRRVNPDIC